MLPRPEIPLLGSRIEHVLQGLFKRKTADLDWRRGRAFSLVYPTGRADIDDLLLQANVAYLYENALNLRRFPSLKVMEDEVTAMVTSLVHGPHDAGSGFTSGGTESIFMSVLVSRERAKSERGIQNGNIVFPRSAHPAFAKAAFYTGLEIRPTSITEEFVADVDVFTEAIDENTVLAMGSAYGNPHGVLDPIEQLSEIAASRGVPFHSDACIGGFVLPFMERLGIEVAPFDFRLPGVTQMSCDVHKYGYSTKGASVVVYRDASWLEHQVFTYDLWPSGHYRTPSVSGARSASPIAAAWSIMNYLGEDGYTEVMRGLLDTTARMRAGIESVPGMQILGDPVGPLLSFTIVGDDIFAICDVMDDLGWGLNRIANPPALHMMISPIHAAHVDEFVADLKFAAEHHGESRGQGASYN
jgi:glutamate/tyrosine decarboxylase-like PLP-dependent enzyme